MNLKHFWGVLPSVFTKDFWIVNKKLRKACNTYEIKKWAKANGYSWNNSWYLDGEKFLYKNGVKVCMIQPLSPNILTRRYVYPFNCKRLQYDHTFLLNHNKTANALFKCICKEFDFLCERDKIYAKIADKLTKLGDEYSKSEEFVIDLAKLSFGNYYDIMALQQNTNLSIKEKKQYIGDYYNYDTVIIKHYISLEEKEQLERVGEEFSWNWVMDLVPTALNRDGVDSILCINPEKLPEVIVTQELLERIHKVQFKDI